MLRMTKDTLCSESPDSNRMLYCIAKISLEIKEGDILNGYTWKINISTFSYSQCDTVGVKKVGLNNFKAPPTAKFSRGTPFAHTPALDQDMITPAKLKMLGLSDIGL
jgi:hypothetical protein